VVRHPNVVQLYGMLGSHEDQPDGSPTAYLALKREGPDLATLLNDPHMGECPVISVVLPSGTSCGRGIGLQCTWHVLSGPMTTCQHPCHLYTDVR